MRNLGGLVGANVALVLSAIVNPEAFHRDDQHGPFSGDAHF